MKIKFAPSLEELDAAPWREIEAHFTAGISVLTTAVHKAETDLLIDAVEQQIAAWETLAARDESS